MPKKQLLLHLIVACLCIKKIYAQQADDPIDTYGFNEKFLEPLRRIYNSRPLRRSAWADIILRETKSQGFTIPQHSNINNSIYS